MRSKMVVDRERAARSVSQAAETHAAQVATSLAPKLQAELGTGEKLPDLELVIKLIGRALSATVTPLVQADEAHDAELRDDAGPRRKRDETTLETYAILTRLRGAVGTVYGAAGVALLGFSGATPTEPIAVKELGASVLLNLPKLNDLEPQDDTVTFNATSYRKKLTKALEAMGEAIGAVTRETREAEATLAAKQRALVAHDEQFRLTAGALSGLFALGELPELAERVRPSTSRAAASAEPSDPAAAPPADAKNPT